MSAQNALPPTEEFYMQKEKNMGGYIENMEDQRSKKKPRIFSFKMEKKPKLINENRKLEDYCE